jgi:hypothetical protein
MLRSVPASSLLQSIDAHTKFYRFQSFNALSMSMTNYRACVGSTSDLAFSFSPSCVLLVLVPFFGAEVTFSLHYVLLSKYDLS